MKKTFILFFCSTALFLVLLFLAQSTNAADWPMYRADAARSGSTTTPLPKQLALQWIQHASHAPQPAWTTSSRMAFDFAYQPIIMGNTVIFGSSADDKVVALDAQTGQVRWTFFTEGPVRFAPAGWRDRIFVASDDGCLYALAWSDGRLLWKHCGAPNTRLCFGNQRMISRWPARGGPVVFENKVYYAAGIWPSDSVFLHALDAETGKVVWTNDQSGGITMPQPHPTAVSKSGVAPQGYLLATGERIFVPTGRAVPAAFHRADGKLDYYHLQKNHSIGGTRAVIVDRYFYNAGCFFDRQSGKIAARCGRGILTNIANGVLQSTGKQLVGYHWKEMERVDRKGKKVSYRGLQKFLDVSLGTDPTPKEKLEHTLQELPQLKNLYQVKIRFTEDDASVQKQNNLECVLAQLRPQVESFGLSVVPFLATSYEKATEVVVAGNEAICGRQGRVDIVDLATQQVRWSHEVEGTALGLAVANGQLLVSTDRGILYCFDTNEPKTALASKEKVPGSATSKPTASKSPIDYEAAAEEIVQTSGITEGICLDLGCADGELALQLAKKTNLQILAIDDDPKLVALARQKIDAAGLYGTRISVRLGNPADPPFPDSCANLVISARSFSPGEKTLPPETVARLQRPFGGVSCFGKLGHLQINIRGDLEGAGQWTHQNANPANTICSTDRLIKGPLEMFWFRDVLFNIPDRHGQGPAPLVNRGCLVVGGVDGLCTLDAFNGRTLWTYPIPGLLKDYDGVHHDVGVGDTGGCYCLSDDSVYVRFADYCLRIDLQTGKLLGKFHVPMPSKAANRDWAYVAFHQGVLFGSVANAEHTVTPCYAGIRLRTESVLFFALDAQTGKLLWKYTPKHSIRNNAITIAGDRVYLIDRPLAMADRITTPEPNGKHRPRLKPGEHPGGVLLAFEGKTGKTLWKQPNDIYGTQLAVSGKHDILLMYYQAVKHNFFRLPSEVGGRMTAFDTATGKRLWDIEAHNVTRPIINGQTIYAEGGSWQLKTGKEVPFPFKRSYGCGQICSSTNLMLFRSGTLGYLDLTRDAGIENFGGLRPGCWFNAIPASGLVLVPDGASKCACSYQTHAWLALRKKNEKP